METGAKGSAAAMDGLVRARDAAEALEAEGVTVTARAIQARAGVRMSAAAQAAREHAAMIEAAGAIPEMPAAVVGRAAAIWREAVIHARTAFSEDKAGWSARLDAAEREVDDLREDLAEADRARVDAVEGAKAAAAAAKKDSAAKAAEIIELRENLAAARDLARAADRRREAAEKDAMAHKSSADVLTAQLEAARREIETLRTALDALGAAK